MDFLSDAFSDGRQFRILAIVDDFTRECLALVPDTSLPGLRVVRELNAVISVRGPPVSCVSDNGTEFTGIQSIRQNWPAGSIDRGMYPRRAKTSGWRFGYLGMVAFVTASCRWCNRL